MFLILSLCLSIMIPQPHYSDVVLSRGQGTPIRILQGNLFKRKRGLYDLFNSTNCLRFFRILFISSHKHNYYLIFCYFLLDFSEARWQIFGTFIPTKTRNLSYLSAFPNKTTIPNTTAGYLE